MLTLLYYIIINEDGLLPHYWLEECVIVQMTQRHVQRSEIFVAFNFTCLMSPYYRSYIHRNINQP